MIGYFVIDKFIEQNLVEAHSARDTGISGEFYLPPLNRQNTSNIGIFDQFFGILDEISGIGALLCALDHDFEGRFDYALTVNADISATGDVKAGAVSLKNHIHTITGLEVTAGEPPSPIGTGAGVTNPPTGG